MKLSNFIEGLKILQSYYKNDKDCHIGAEHDFFFAYRTDIPLTKEDVQKMVKLGWEQSSGGITESGGEYDPDGTWSTNL